MKSKQQWHEQQKNKPITQFNVYSPELSRMVLVPFHVGLHLAGSTNQNNEFHIICHNIKRTQSPHSTSPLTWMMTALMVDPLAILSSPCKSRNSTHSSFFFCKKNFWPGCRTSANLSWIVSFRTSTSLVFEGEVVGVKKDMSRLCWPILTSTVFSIFQICKRQRAQACVQRKATLNHSPDKDIKTWILLIRKRKSIALWVGQTL